MVRRRRASTAEKQSKESCGLTKRRILALDGGGIKGTFSASFLAQLEKKLQHPIAHYFDLIVGTSTGGIIALGLGLGLSAADLLSFYVTAGPEIFCRRSRIPLWTRLGMGKYDPDRLRHHLTQSFGDRLFGESRSRLVIPSVDLDTGEVRLFKTAHAPRLMTDLCRSAIDVALATAAAPSYFPPHRLPTGVPLVDGGICAGNPTGLAVCEAVGVLGWERESLRVLSIGTTRSPLDIGRGGLLDWHRRVWIHKLVDLMIACQSSYSLGTASILVGEANLFRIDPVAPSGRFKLDSHKHIDSLIGLGDTFARQEIPRLSSVFFEEPAMPFEPCIAASDRVAGG